MDNSVTSEESFRDKFILTFGLPNKSKIIDLFNSYDINICGMKSILLLIFSFFLFSVSCEKNKNIDECQWSDYYFEHPVSVYPIKESYNLGDTIWCEINMSSLFNVKIQSWYNHTFKNEIINLKNFDFKRTFLAIRKLQDSTQSVIGQPDQDISLNFSTIFKTGQIVQMSNIGPEYKLEYDSCNYKLKFGFVTKTIGKYILYPIFVPLSFNHLELNNVTLNEKCPNKQQIKGINFPINKQNDSTYLTNYNIFKKIMNVNNESRTDWIEKESFTFIVK